MDLINMKSLLVLLFTIGCCVGQGVLPPGPREAVLGKNVTFETVVKPEDEFLTISWEFNDGTGPVSFATVTPSAMNVVPAYQGRVWVNKVTGSLTLGPLKASDTGEYSVTLVNKLTAKGSVGEIKLVVLEPVSDVVINANASEVVEFNSTVVLTCSAKGSSLKFSWSSGTKPIVADGKRLTLTEVEKSSVLTLTGVLRSDLVDPIYCTASNKLETESSAPFNLTVSYGPENIAIAIQPLAKVVKSGTNLTISCSAQSSPAAQLMWYHNGQKLAMDGPELVLTDVPKEKGGNYSCMGYNKKTMRYVSSTVVQFSVQEALTGASITAPTETLIAGNQTVNLSCQATAGTPRTRAWMKDNKPLSPSARVVISKDMSTVTITTVQKEDNGEYKCQLANDVSSDSAVYKMVVNFGPEAATVTGEDAVEVTDVVKLKCSAVSVPAANYTWKFNGTMTSVKAADYSIEKAVYKNTGTYTCVAHNAVTGLTATFDHKLSVKEEGALEEGLSEGAVAGIIIGVLVALAIVIGGVIYFRRKQTSIRTSWEDQSAQSFLFDAANCHGARLFVGGRLLTPILTGCNGHEDRPPTDGNSP
ncbi:cell adhesion molecule CEACAM5 [Diretmus argenteus]